MITAKCLVSFSHFVLEQMKEKWATVEGQTEKLDRVIVVTVRQTAGQLIHFSCD